MLCEVAQTWNDGAACSFSAKMRVALQNQLVPEMNYSSRHQTSLKELGKSVGNVRMSISSSLRCSAALFENGKEFIKIFCN